MINKIQFERLVAEKCGCTYKDMGIIMDALISVFNDLILKKERIKIPGFMDVHVNVHKGRRRIDVNTKKWVQGRDYYTVFAEFNSVIEKQLKKMEVTEKDVRLKDEVLDKKRDEE